MNKLITETHIIDCDAAPFVPDGWSVEEHKRGGQFKFDPTRVELYLCKPQRKEDDIVRGHVLRKELKGKPVMNANVLDYLLCNPHLIPEEWKENNKGDTRHTFFWGTIYRASDEYKYECVRYLFFHNNKWMWDNRAIVDTWYFNYYAALRKD